LFVVEQQNSLQAHAYGTVMKLSTLILAAAVAITASLLAAPLAGAATKDKALATCQDSEGQTSPIDRIAACTKVIDEGRLKGNDLSIIYRIRGTQYMIVAEQTGDKSNITLAIADFDKGIELSPTSATPYLTRCVAHFRLEDFERALADCTKASELNPKLAAAWGGRAMAHQALGNLEVAVKDAGEAIRLEPKAPRWYRARAGALRMLERHAEAVKDLDKAIALSPPDAEKALMLRQRGLSHGELGDFKKAIADLDEANRLKPNDRTILNDRCWVRGQWGQELDKALADCDASLAIEKASTTYDSRGFVNLRRGDPSSAFVDFDAAVKLDADRGSPL